MTPRVADPARAAETEVAILEAARDLLAEGGLDALSMRATAARVGLSATAIYNYFENKQALVDRVVLSGFERFNVYMREAASRAPEGSADRIHALGEAYIRFALENQQYFKVLFTMQPDRQRELDELPEHGGYFLFRQSVVDAMDSGELRRADPDIVVMYLWSHVHGLVTLFLACKPDPVCSHTGKSLNAPELFLRCREFVMDGLRQSGARQLEAASGE